MQHRPRPHVKNTQTCNIFFGNWENIGGNWENIFISVIQLWAVCNGMSEVTLQLTVGTFRKGAKMIFCDNFEYIQLQQMYNLLVRYRRAVHLPSITLYIMSKNCFIFFCLSFMRIILRSTTWKSRTELKKLFKNKWNSPNLFEAKVQNLLCLGTLSW